MPLKDFHCLHCGAPLDEMRQDGTYHCTYCDRVFKDESLQKEIQTMEFMFEGVLLEQKEEQVANIRRNLYNATHEEYISSQQIITYCREMKKLLPDDFQANFYEVANNGTPVEINRFLDNTDIEENDIYALDVVNFMISSLDSKSVMSVKNYINKAAALHVFTPEQFTELTTRVEEEAVKLDEGIYSTVLPRDVFVAYSSADMDKVEEIVAFLEENEISCFTALRNLRHGRGARENYISALQEAIHNCKCVVFLSSENSRRLACDALRVELPYIRDHEKKMGKIEFVINDYGSMTTTAAKKLLESFFQGLEYCRTKEDLLVRVLQYTTGIVEDEKRKAEEELERKQKELEIQRIALEESQRKQQEEYRKRQEELARQQQEQYQKQQEELARRQQEELERIREELTRNTVSSNATNGVKFYDRNKYKITGTILEEYKGNEIYPEIPNGVTDISEGAFSDSAIVSITIPNTVVYIGDNAFESCGKLMAIYLPSSVQQIGKNVFDNCNRYLTIFTPNRFRPALWDKDFSGGAHVVWDYRGTPNEARRESQRLANERAERERLEQEAAEARRLEEARLAKEREEQERIAKLFEISGTKLVRVRLNERDVVIPEGIETIGENAFESCYYLTSLTIPKTVKSIETNAFRACNKLNSINVFDLDSWCNIDFADENANPCFKAKIFKLKGEEITELVIPRGINPIKKFNFIGCPFTKITILDGVTSIESRAFSQSKNLLEIVLPNTLRIIEDHAFEYCSSLKTITIPRGVISIGATCFNQCKALVKVELPNTLKQMGVFAFSGCESLTEVVIPEGFESIPDYAFKGCSRLKKITLPSTLESIGAEVFSQCNSLTAITIPENVKDISPKAFADCRSLVAILGKIDNETLKGFVGNKYLEFAYIFPTAKEIDSGAFKDFIRDFLIFTPLKEKPAFWKENWNNGYKVVWGFEGTFEEAYQETKKYSERKANIAKLFDVNNDCTEILKYKGKQSDVIIPEGIEIIGKEAFKDNPDIKTLSLPKSVREIGESAFYNCKLLSSIDIKEGLLKIGNNAFEACPELSKVVLPNSLASIGNEAFMGCGKLAEATIPTKLEHIGDRAFENCISLDLPVPQNVKHVGKDAFRNNKKEHYAQLRLLRKQITKSSVLTFPFLLVTFVITLLLWLSFYFGFGTLQVGTTKQLLVAIGIPVSIGLVILDWILIHKIPDPDDEKDTGMGLGLFADIALIIALILLLWGQWNGACVVAAYVFLGIIVLFLGIFYAVDAYDGNLRIQNIPTCIMMMLTIFVFFTSVVACWWNLVESNNGTSDVTAIVNMLSLLIR